MTILAHNSHRSCSLPLPEIVKYLVFVVFISQLNWAQVDLVTLNKIKMEGFRNSHVMEHVFWLTDVCGSRLAGSSNFTAAAEWVRKKLQTYGLESVCYEKWGPFGRSWRNTFFSANLVEPVPSFLIGGPLAWTAGTHGEITADAVFAPIQDASDLDQYKGKLKGKIVLAEPMRKLAPSFDPIAQRLSDTELAKQSAEPEPAPRALVSQQTSGTGTSGSSSLSRIKIGQFCTVENASVILVPGSIGDGGTVFATSGGSRDLKDPLTAPMVALTPEHYNRIARLLQNGIPVKASFDIRNEIGNETADSFNVIAEIPGHKKKDEFVLLGAHLDSWQLGTGATDNAAGVAVMMEAVRILKVLDLKMDRTVRIALWGGEEQGGLGSLAYVRKHLADPQTLERAPEYSKLSTYFNLDVGTGKIRGIYMEENDVVRPIFEEWMTPLKALGVTAIAPRQTQGSDHVWFNMVGVPGFVFLQDPIEYFSRTHHSNMDLYDRIQGADLMQAAVVVAFFAYSAAMHPEMLPRVQTPKTSNQVPAVYPK